MTAQDPQRWPWLRKHLAVIGAVLVTALTAALTDFVREVFKGGASMLGSVSQWMLQPSSMPNGVAVLALGIVLAAVIFGVAPSVRAWRARSSSEEQTLFRGGIYLDRLWKWDVFNSDFEPKGLRLLCSVDGAALEFGGSDADAMVIRAGRPISYFCPDCGARDEQLPSTFNKVAALIRRDLETGEWLKRQRSFDLKRRELAANSPSIAGKGGAGTRGPEK